MACGFLIGVKLVKLTSDYRHMANMTSRGRAPRQTSENVMSVTDNPALSTFLGNSESVNLSNMFYDSTRLKWAGDFESSKKIMSDVFSFQGKWTSPGGISKKFTSSNAELSLTWHSGKQNSLLFQDKDGYALREKRVFFCEKEGRLVNSESSTAVFEQEREIMCFKASAGSASVASKIAASAIACSLPSCQILVGSTSVLNTTVNNCTQTPFQLTRCNCSCGLLLAELEGMKLDIEILQSRTDSLQTPANTQMVLSSENSCMAEIKRLKPELCNEKNKTKQLKSDLAAAKNKLSVCQDLKLKHNRESNFTINKSSHVPNVLPLCIQKENPTLDPTSEVCCVDDSFGNSSFIVRHTT